jgi:hypothetical protein
MCEKENPEKWAFVRLTRMGSELLRWFETTQVVKFHNFIIHFQGYERRVSRIRAQNARELRYLGRSAALEGLGH